MRRGPGVAAMAGGVLVLAACGGPRADAQTGFAAGDGSYTRIAPAVRVNAQTLTGVDLAGKPLSTAADKGRVLVINVWGSWCAPCRHEAPALVAAAATTTGRASFVGINTRDLTATPAQAFVRAFKVGYPSFYDPTGALLLEIPSLPPQAIPSTIVIDPRGRVAARVLGEVTSATLVGLIDDVAAGR